MATRKSLSKDYEDDGPAVSFAGGSGGGGGSSEANSNSAARSSAPVDAYYDGIHKKTATAVPSKAKPQVRKQLFTKGLPTCFNTVL
jgi:hypothetical protein